MSDVTNTAVDSTATPGVALMDQQPDDSVPARSPLHHVAQAQTGEVSANARVSIWEEPLKTHLILRGDAAAAGFREGVQAATGLDLPEPLQSQSKGDWSLSWITPDEWLLVGPGDQAFTMESRLREQLEGHYAVVNVGGGQSIVRLSGTEARSVLMKSCPYDVHDRHFPVGKVVTTVLGKTQATLRRLGDNDWEIVVRRSFADYIWRWLLDAASEHGVHTGPLLSAVKGQASHKTDTSTV
ncbi:sarcosine oxidase subunit gamma [Marinobacter halodurans]|uniref:Sarcosine oxidase subunit gamma n=1 Tax=Marinobacter halodurans TaxID=2528979 RepID=A0ABY1ZK03_9GAMM|nr:sarcosine oxidase subunit gamma family protein [Marinobacter halodurans]TBW55734.1 sarcosine oxidase subunit gamma [Marinobacter halodurans]